jgi:glycosyl transferase family 87
VTRTRLSRAALGVLWCYAALLVVACIAHVVAAGHDGSDFWTFWRSGRDVLHGRSPYPSLASLPADAGRTFAPFVYPPVAALWMAPLAVLPFAAANVVFVIVNLAAIGGALWLLGVRDPRCYGIAYGSAPVFAAAALGTVSPLLLLGVAGAWRYRERAVVVGLLVAAVVTMKLFLWPLGLWLLATRRFRAAAVSFAAGAVAIVGSWAAISFAGMREYPQLLGRLTELVGPHGYSLYALERALGIGGTTAQTSVYLAAVLAVALAARFVRGDQELLLAALGISLLATPILWPHYLVLLFVPLALAARSFSPLWIALLLLWVDASAWSEGSVVRIGGLLALSGVVVWRALERGEAARSSLLGELAGVEAEALEQGRVLVAVDLLG